MTVYDFADLDLERQLVQRAEARRVRYAQYRSMATPELATRATALYSAYPNLPAGVVQSLSLAGVEADSSVANETAKLQAQADAEDGKTLAGEKVDPGVFGRLTGIGKGIVRGALTGLMGAYHEIVARPIVALHASDPDHYGPDAMSFSEAYAAEGDSPLVRAFKALAEGERVELGSGFLPGGEMMDAHLKQVESLKLPGSDLHVTPGRAIAQGVTWVEPGTRGFNTLSGAIDFGLNVADPTAAALKSVGMARKAERTFGAAGMSFADQLRSAGGLRDVARKTVVKDVANNWLDTNPVAQRLINHLAGEGDFTTIWQNMGRGSGIGRTAARKIADEADPAEIREILRREIVEGRLRRKPTATATGRALGTVAGAIGEGAKGFGRRASADSAFEAGRLYGVGAAVRQGKAGTRSLQMMPKTYLDVNNLDWSQEQLDRFMRTAKLSDEDIREAHDVFSRIDPNDPDRALRMREVVVSVLAKTDQRLRDKGVASEFTKKIVRMFGEDYAEDLRIYYQEFGDDVIFEGSKVRFELDATGNVVQKARPTAQLLTEYTEVVPLVHSIREFRQSTGALGKFLWDKDNMVANGVKGSARFWDALMARWSQSQLLRVAWPVRVTLESQARFAAEGLDSAYNHPIAFLRWSFMHKGDTDLLGNPLEAAKQFHAALGRRGNASHLVGRERQAMAWYDVHKPEVPDAGMANGEFVKSWVGEMSLLWNDDITRRVAGGLQPGDTLGSMKPTGNTVDDITNWLVHGNGRDRLEALATAPDKRHFLTDPDAVRRYVGGGIQPDGTEVKGVKQRLFYQTGGRPELLDAIAKGNIDGVDLTRMSYDRKKVYSKFFEYIDDAPPVVKGVKTFSPQVMDRVIDRWFEVLFTVQDNTLNRIPGYKQFYWKSVPEYVTRATPEVQKQILAQAKAAGMSGAELRNIRSLIKTGSGDVFDDIAQIDYLAKDYALENVRKMLYDVSERSNFAEGTRFVTAFAEAWKEIGQTWTRLAIENPQVIRRTQQIVDGARDSGFLYPDPQSGEERFAYPGGGALLTALLKVAGVRPTDLTPEQQASLKLEGNARSLNLFSSTVIPGLGPVSTLGLSYFLPDKPEYDDLRKMLMPFGGEEPDSVGGVVEHLMPSFWKKLGSGIFGEKDGVNDAVWMSTNADMTNYLVANGDYIDENGMLDQQRLADDAIKMSRGALLLRGVMQSILPASPQVEVFLDPKDGGPQIHYYALGQELRDLQEELGYSGGMNEFLNRYGPEALMAGSARSTTIRKRALSRTGAAWERSHPDLVARHPDVAGYFAPGSEEDLDMTSWGRAIDNGDIIRLSDEQRIAATNRMVAYWKLDQAEALAAQHPDQAQADAFMAEIRQSIEADYPGVFDRVGVATGMPADKKIGALIKAVNDEPELANTDAGKGLKKYLDAREKAMASVPQYSKTAKGYADAKSTAPIRAWLRQVGEALALEHPEFRPMWDEVFMREGRMSPDKEYAATMSANG